VSSRAALCEFCHCIEKKGAWPKPTPLHNPAKLTRLVVGCFPNAGQELVVVRPRALPQYELRLPCRFVVHGRERAGSDDDIATVNFDLHRSRLPQQIVRLLARKKKADLLSPA